MPQVFRWQSDQGYLNKDVSNLVSPHGYALVTKLSPHQRTLSQTVHGQHPAA